MAPSRSPCTKCPALTARISRPSTYVHLAFMCGRSMGARLAYLPQAASPCWGRHRPGRHQQAFGYWPAPKCVRCITQCWVCERWAVPALRECTVGTVMGAKCHSEREGTHKWQSMVWHRGERRLLNRGTSGICRGDGIGVQFRRMKKTGVEVIGKGS